jgi:predicted enzyme related to lactoylglutathione lyase
MATGRRKAGEFCWTNMITPQPAEAREFFGRLLGWTYFEIPGHGHGVRVGGHDVGGIFDLDGPNTPPGTTPHLGGLLKVADADATGAKVVALGGTSQPAFDIGDQGRMAECWDPNGAKFVVWEPKTFHGTEVDSSLHGAPCWFETLTTDVGGAVTFYSGLLGWTADVMPMPGYDYTVFKLGKDPVAGLMRIAPAMGNLRPHWGSYFTVNDVDAVAEEAVGLGARLCVPVRNLPGVGRFCGITSPQGVTFYVIRYGSPAT